MNEQGPKRRKPTSVEKAVLGVIGIDANVVTPALDVLYHRIGSMESDNNPNAAASESSAKGVYQYLTGNAKYDASGKKTHNSSYETALNRLERAFKRANEKVPSWVEKARKDNDPRKLTREQANQVLIADLVLTDKPSARPLQKWLVEGDVDGLKQVYAEVHHTDTQQNSNVEPRMEERLLSPDADLYALPPSAALQAQGMFR